MKTLLLRTVTAPKHETMRRGCTCRRAMNARKQACRWPKATASSAAAPSQVLPASDIENMASFLDGLKWDTNGLVVAIAQHADTGEVLMQAFADKNAVLETLQTGCVVTCYNCFLAHTAALRKEGTVLTRHQSGAEPSHTPSPDCSLSVTSQACHLLQQVPKRPLV